MRALPEIFAQLVSSVPGSGFLYQNSIFFRENNDKLIS